MRTINEVSVHEKKTEDLNDNSVLKERFHKKNETGSFTGVRLSDHLIH